MNIKHKIKDIVYLCPDLSKPDKIEVRLVLGIEYKNETKHYELIENPNGTKEWKPK